MREVPRRSRLRDLLPTPQEFDVERLLKNPAVGLHSVSMGLRRRDIAELYDRRYVGFRNAAATITGSYESAADVVQEAFAEALVQRRRFRGDGSPEAWVWRIVMRTANRERGRRFRETPSGDGLAAEADLPEPPLDPALKEALRALAPRRRLIVFLHYFADLSYSEIAEFCDVSEGTVAATLAQARERMRSVLEAQEGARR